MTLVGAFSVITNLRMELFEAIVDIPLYHVSSRPGVEAHAEHGAAHGGGLDPARHRQRGLGRAVVRRLHRRPAQQVHVAGHAQLQMELSINFDIT